MELKPCHSNSRFDLESSLESPSNQQISNLKVNQGRSPKIFVECHRGIEQ